MNRYSKLEGFVLTTLYLQGNKQLNLLNVYSDSNHMAIKWIAENKALFPALDFMAGDFNCHSPIWNPRVMRNNHVANTLCETAQDLGLEVSIILSNEESNDPTSPSNPAWVPTHFPYNSDNQPTVIDLVFIPLEREVGHAHTVREDLMEASDHVSLFYTLKTPHMEFVNTKLTMPMDSHQELSFIKELSENMRQLDISELNTANRLDEVVYNLGNAITSMWESNAKPSKICSRSKTWWNTKCTEAIRTFRAGRRRDNYCRYKATMKEAKYNFFDNHIKEIATKNQRPWDLMECTKQRS